MSRDTLGSGQWLLTVSSLLSKDGSVDLGVQSDRKITVDWPGRWLWQSPDEQNFLTNGIQLKDNGNVVM